LCARVTQTPRGGSGTDPEKVGRLINRRLAYGHSYVADGVKVAKIYNVPTMINDGRAFDFHIGLYANGWHDDGGMKGTQGTRQVWYDEISVGTTFADADPASW
jgi:hypothetical protein